MNQDPNYRMMFPSLKETNMLRCDFSHNYREASALFLILCLVSFIRVLLMLPCLFTGTLPELQGKGERGEKNLMAKLNVPICTTVSNPRQIA